jgi:hypothetical protein
MSRSASTSGQRRTSSGDGRGDAGDGRQPLPPPLTSNRVRVAVRCRPPFEEEGLTSAVHIGPPPVGGPPGAYPKSLALELTDKRKEFGFDVVLGPETTNNAVYDVVAGPIVDGVMKGVNGTVMAYGQTGSGKTHSLGILTRVSGESGIIPRALSHIFGYIASAAAPGSPEAGTTFTVTMSFLQIYLDTVQDLLSPTRGPAPAHHGRTSNTGDALNASSASLFGGGGVNTSMSSAVSGVGGGGGKSTPGGGWAVSLNVREDPSRGFYVEGASEFVVSTFADALGLLNHGLEARVLGATRMNATSSRSHTMLQVRVEAKQPVSLGTMMGDGGAAPPPVAGAPPTAPYGFVTRRSQLVLADLAGSERVRRTSSRGARLEEARAINASLHTLGQVIAALAIVSAQTGGGAPRVHVPWRDSKLTRLLYGNLGGSANTFLLATVGPSARNSNETLSTLAFATRCMRVSSAPAATLAHTQVDYADLCARLQARLAGIEAVHAGELGALSRRYEGAIVEAKAAAEAAQVHAEEVEAAAARALANAGTGRPLLLDGPPGDVSVSALTSVAVSLLEDEWGEGTPRPGVPLSILAAVYSDMCHAFDASAAVVAANLERHARVQKAWAEAIDRARAEEGASGEAREAMRAHDPLALAAAGAGAAAPGVALPDSFGPQLGGDYRSAAAAMTSVHAQHGSNSGRALGGGGGSLLRPPAAPPGTTTRFHAYVHAPFDGLVASGGPPAVLAQCASLSAAAAENCARMDGLLASKDVAFDEIKRHCAGAEASMRVRDEDVQAQRYVLKYLVDTTASLREELARASGGGLRGRSEGQGEGRPRLRRPREVPISPVPSPPRSPEGSPSRVSTLPSEPVTARADEEVDDLILGAEEEDEEEGGGRYDGKGRVQPPAPPPAPATGRPPRPPSKPADAPAPRPPAAHIEDGSSGGGGADEVERVVAHRVVAGPGGAPRMLYKVRWRGTGPGEDEWFPREDLVADFPAAVQGYEAAMKAAVP